LVLRNEPAMPTVSAGSATPTVPLLLALVVIAAFVATPALAATVLSRLLRNKVSEVS
jgi:ABC-type proline/glycine betaine transport system permease subunit